MILPFSFVTLNTQLITSKFIAWQGRRDHRTITSLNRRIKYFTSKMHSLQIHSSNYVICIIWRSSRSTFSSSHKYVPCCSSNDIYPFPNPDGFGVPLVPSLSLFLPCRRLPVTVVLLATVNSKLVRCNITVSGLVPTRVPVTLHHGTARRRAGPISDTILSDADVTITTIYYRPGLGVAGLQPFIFQRTQKHTHTLVRTHAHDVCSNAFSYRTLRSGHATLITRTRTHARCVAIVQRTFSWCCIQPR